MPAPFSIALAQLPGTPRNADDAIALHLGLASVAAEAGAQLTVFPELSLTGYTLTPRPDEILRGDDCRVLAIRDYAVRTGMTIIAGAPLRRGDALHIGAIIAKPTGELLRQAKQYPHSSETPPYAPAGSPALLPVGAHLVGLAICADTGRAEHAAAAAEKGAFAYIASSLISKGGYADDSARLRARAVTYRLPVMLANYGGPSGGYESAGRSAVWDHEGAVLGEAPDHGAGVLLAEFDGARWTARSLPLL